MLALSPSTPTSRGFTLLELLVVIAMLALLASLAAPSFQSSINNRRVSAAASELMAGIVQARNEAITNNRQAMVQPLTPSSADQIPDWALGWRIYIDIDKDKGYTEGTDQLIMTVPALSGGVTSALQLPLRGNRTTLRELGFDSRGFLLDQNAGRITFYMASAPDALIKGIKISRTGRSRVCVSTTSDDGCAGSSD